MASKRTVEIRYIAEGPSRRSPGAPTRVVAATGTSILVDLEENRRVDPEHQIQILLRELTSRVRWHPALRLQLQAAGQRTLSGDEKEFLRGSVQEAERLAGRYDSTVMS